MILNKRRTINDTIVYWYELNQLFTLYYNIHACCLLITFALCLFWKRISNYSSIFSIIIHISVLINRGIQIWNSFQNHFCCCCCVALRFLDNKKSKNRETFTFWLFEKLDYPLVYTEWHNFCRNLLYSIG